MTLLPFYNQQSKFTSRDDFFTRIINNDLTSKKLWEPFHQSFPKFNLTKLPKKLDQIKEIPMDDLISQLKSLGQITEASELPNWVYTLIYLFGALLVGIAMFILCKYRRKVRFCLSCSARRGGGEKGDEYRCQI